MLDFLQLGRPITITTPLTPGAVLIAGLRGREAMNELYEFEFDLLAPLALPPLNYDDLLGKIVTATIDAGFGMPRRITGTVMALEEVSRDREFTRFTATIRPSWWLATLQTNSRIFQQETARTILQTVLSPFGTLDIKLDDDYPTRDFTCQYQESDWTFARRIMEEEGIFFSFLHTTNGPTLVLADDLNSAPKAEMLGPLRFDTEQGSPGGREYRCWTWKKRQTVVPTTVTLWDSHFELYRQNLAGDASAPPRATAGEVTHHPAPSGVGTVPVYDHLGDYAKRYDGVTPGGVDQSSDLEEVFSDATRTARIRAEAFAAPSVRIIGEGNCPALTPGSTFLFADHYDGDGEYLMYAVEHEIIVEGTFRGGQPEPGFRYRNRFEARPTDLLPRPPKITPRPRVGGPLTAVVVGPTGEEIFVDKYGRIKVQFLWDRQGQSNADSSCWIRCAQLWAGKTWGAFFWPRIGMEVVVHFEDGDIDRPIVTGCVYNATNMTPTQLPAESTIGGIKSLIFQGSPTTNFNALYIHDTPGVEYVQIHSEVSDMQQSEGGRYHYTQNMMFDIRGHL